MFWTLNVFQKLKIPKGNEDQPEIIKELEPRKPFKKFRYKQAFEVPTYVEKIGPKKAKFENPALSRHFDLIHSNTKLIAFL